MRGSLDFVNQNEEGIDYTVKNINYQYYVEGSEQPNPADGLSRLYL